MSEKDVISLLRHKRHDWMNQIQLIHGYATLGKQDRLMDQLEQLREESEHERRLLNSHASHFPMWLITFNWNHEQFRIQYKVNDRVDLSRHDRRLTACGKRMIEIMNEFKMADVLYEGTLHIHQGYETDSVGLSWEWTGLLKESDDLKRHLNDEGFIATIFEDEELSIEMMIE